MRKITKLALNFTQNGFSAMKMDTVLSVLGLPYIYLSNTTTYMYTGEFIL